MVDPYVDVVEKALKISSEIQFATVCNVLGVVKHSDHKSNTNNSLSKSERLKSIESSTRTWSLRNEFASKIGKGEFVIAQYDEIKCIVIPLDDDHLLYLTTTKNADHNKITSKATQLKLGKIKKIRKIRQKHVIAKIILRIKPRNTRLKQTLLILIMKTTIFFN